MRMLILLCRRLRGELSACVFFPWWRVAADGLRTSPHGPPYDPIYWDSLKPNNVALNTIYSSPGLKLISVTMFWGVALKMVRYQKGTSPPSAPPTFPKTEMITFHRRPSRHPRHAPTRYKTKRCPMDTPSPRRLVNEGMLADGVLPLPKL